MRKFSIATIFALATLSVSMAYAATPTQIELSSFGNTSIDLAWSESNRIVKNWTEFANFNPNDGSYSVQIVHVESGKIVSDSKVQIITQSSSDLIDFKSFTMYQVNVEDLCENENASLKDCNPLTGQFEMRVQTNDGIAKDSTSFEIVDSRK